MGFVAAGVAVRLKENLSWGPKKGQYYAGTDSGTYGSGYPIYRDLAYVMDGKAAAELVKSSPDPLTIVPVYIDDGE